MFIMQSWMESFQRWIASLGPWGRVMVIAGIALVSFVLIVIVYFQKSIQTRLDDMERRLSKGLVYRDEMGKGQKRTRAMELHPDFQTGVMSLGQYLSSLRISDESMPELLQRELEATIGSTLLQHFGPRLGAALLPMLGISQVDSWITKAAGAIAAFVASHVLVEVVSENDDVAAFPFSVSEIVAFVNLNQKIRSAEAPAINPLEWMQRGEIGYSPSFTSTSDDDNSCHDLFPNPFVLERHFESTVAAMEDRIRGQSSVTATNPSANTESSKTSEAYDPDDRSLPKPVPINERILPGLHMG